MGVTPILSWAQALTETDETVHLVYCVKSRPAAAHLDELQVLADVKPNLQLHVHVSAQDGRATAESILSLTGQASSDLVVSFCGPKPMREVLKADFAKLGVSRRNFRYEEFEIRTGVGLRRLAELLLKGSKELSVLRKQSGRAN
ncbi:MAG: hypothetical protein P8L32_05610 [Paracoccaceae bacterium]|nr:hypothetical protein [Paracoccaceae bacterium]